MNEIPDRKMEKVLFHGLGAGGETVGREITEDSRGRTIFALGGAPQERGHVLIEKEHTSFARGTIQSIEDLSIHRVAAPCPYFGVVETPLQLSRFRPETGCGGCQWQHIEYSMQRASKRDIVVQALRRVGELGDDAELLVGECVSSPREFGYRNKAEFVVTTQLNGTQPITQIGFVRRESHHVVDIECCPIQNENNNLLLKLLREAVAVKFLSDGQTPRSHARQENVLQRVTVRTSSRGESLLLAQTTRASWPQAKEFAAFLMKGAPNLRGVLLRHGKKTRLIAGEDWLQENVLDIKLRVWGDDFFQVNTSLTPTLLQTALDFCELKPGERVLDLFCGVGLFGLALAKRGAQVTGIEGNPRAIEYAKLNAHLNGVEAEFLAGDAAKTLRRWRQQTRTHQGYDTRHSVQETRQVDVVLLDPPRAGARECLAELVSLKPRRIVYISCDPATLARDIKILRTHGYELRRAIPLDLFPQTSHVETVAQLDIV